MMQDYVLNPLCPHCQSDDIAWSEKKQLYRCFDCNGQWENDGEKVDENATEAQNEKRLCQALAGQSGWNMEVINAYPAPIAHEYHQLQKLLQEEKFIPAVLQFKDMCEVLLKFTTLSMYRWLTTTKPELDLQHIKEQFYAKPLSFGSWIALVRELCIVIFDHHQESDHLLGIQLANYFFNKKQNAKKLTPTDTFKWLEQVVQWRNQEIGHGAFRLDVKELYPEFEVLLTKLHQAILNNPYQGFALFLNEKDSEASTPLMGWQSIRHRRDGLAGITHEHHLDCYEIYLQDTAKSGQKIPLSPYVHIFRCNDCHLQDVFMFDSHDRSKFYFLDYLSGHRLKLHAHEQQALDTEVKKANLKLLDDSSLNQDALSQEVVAMLEEKSLEADFIAPTYLQDQLTQAIDEEQKIFWLQASAHVGKSMFVYGLHKNLTKNQQLQDSYVISFHIRREFRYFAHHLAESLGWQLREVFGLTSGNIALPTLDISQGKYALVQFINEYWRLTGKARTAQLIVAIDGLDEIGEPTEQNQISILDLLPDEDAIGQSADNILYLYTSRPAEQCPSWMQNDIKTLYATQTLSVALDYAPYVALLRQYFDRELQTQLKSANKDDKDSLFALLLQKAEHRFLYLSLLVSLIKEQNLSYTQLQELPQAHGLYQYYLEKLATLLGENSKQFKRIKDLLCLLTVCEQAYVTDQNIRTAVLTHIDTTPTDSELNWQGISLATLAGLLDEPNSTHSAQLIFTLYSLKSLFKVERSGDHARYRLGLKSLGEFIADYWQSEVQAWHERLAVPFYQAWHEHWDELPTDEPSNHYQLRYLIAHLQLAECDDVYQRLMVDIELSKLYEQMYNKNEKAQRYTQAMDWLLLDIHLSHDISQICVENWRLVGGLYADVQQYQLAEKSYNHALKLVNKLLEQVITPGGLQLLANVWRSFGILYNTTQNHVESEKAYQTAINLYIKLKDELGEDFSSDWQANLAITWMNFGLLYYATQKPAQAINAYQVAINIYAKLKDQLVEDFPNAWQQDLANTWKNCGILYRNTQNHSQAIHAYETAINLYTELKDKLGEDFPNAWQRSLAMTWMDFGVLYRNIQNHSQAETAYQTAINLYTELKSRQKSNFPNAWQRSLAMTWMNFGILYQNSQNHSQAIHAYEAAINLYTELKDKLGEDFPNAWQKSLASTWMNFGNLNRNTQNHSQAIHAYETAINLYTELKDKLGEDFPNAWQRSLAMTWMNFGILYQNSQNHSQAIHAYEAAINLYTELKDKLGEDFPNAWQQGLANSWRNLGVLYGNIKNHPKSEIAYQIALNLYTKLKERLGEDFPDEWEQYMGMCYEIIADIKNLE